MVNIGAVFPLTIDYWVKDFPFKKFWFPKNYVSLFPPRNMGFRLTVTTSRLGAMD